MQTTHFCLSAMTTNALYTDLSGYYDLMCADIDYAAQSRQVQRLHQLFGNGGKNYLDIACGTGPHLRQFVDAGFSATGVDINQPMLDLARQRCPEAMFYQQDMAALSLSHKLDLISCFLYSIHYNQSLASLQSCFAAVHQALNPGGLFCFNAVDKTTIDNRPGIKRQLHQGDSDFSFQSNWFYPGQGNEQLLQLQIEKTTGAKTQTWRDQHPMVATSFSQLQAMLAPYFDIHLFTHDYHCLSPWQAPAGNAIVVGIAKPLHINYPYKS